MSTTDPFANPPSAGLLFWTQQWNWFVKVITILHTQLQDAQGKLNLQASALATMNSKLEGLMTQDADLTAAVAANTQAVGAVSAALSPLTDAINTAVADVQRLVNLLNAGPVPDPAVLQAINDVTASTSSLQSAAAQLQSATEGLTTAEGTVPA